MPIGRSHPSHSPPGSVGEPGQRAFGRCQQLMRQSKKWGGFSLNSRNVVNSKYNTSW